MSAGYLSNLIKNTRTFILRKVKSEAGLASSPWQHFDTTARVAGVNYTTIVCNPIYTVYFTTEKKDS